MELDIKDFLWDFAIAIPLFIYVMLIVSIVTKRLYDYMVGRGVKRNVAVYYNRKIIHVSTGGVIALLVPMIFREPFTPFVFALILAVITLYPHLKGSELSWFQTKDNAYEVNFCIAWGSSILVLWLYFNNAWISILPALFISIGDAVTGVVRNAIFGKRTKHWVGNLAMAVTTIPIGYSLAGIPGAIAGALATIAERFEFGYIDDNILITIVSIAILIALKSWLP